MDKQTNEVHNIDDIWENNVYVRIRVINRRKKY